MARILQVYLKLTLKYYLHLKTRNNLNTWLLQDDISSVRAVYIEPDQDTLEKSVVFEHHIVG